MSVPRTISLDGRWEFFYSPRKFNSGTEPLPARELFTGAMVTPGYWDDHYELFDEEDFFGLTARFNPDYRKPHFPMGRSLVPHASSSFLIGTGFYRRLFAADFPAGSGVILTVGPAMWGCSVYCNGAFVGRVTGYSTASDFDLGAVFKSGVENELILIVDNIHDDGGAYCRVDGSHDGEAVGARPGQHRGLAAQGYQSERAGIGGGVSLKITGSGTIVDHFLSFEDGRAHWHVEMRRGSGKRLRWSIGDGTAQAASGTIECVSDRVDFILNGFEPRRWSDREPVLYDFQLELCDGAITVDRMTGRWGARTLNCRGDRIYVNELPVYFRGVTEHCYFPESCNPHFDREKYLADFGVLKRAGFNFVRCHTWCPPEPFFDACDELGMLVQTELPSVYSPEEADAIIRLIRRHPSAVILCEGNEKIIDEAAIERLRKLAARLREIAPGMLFNPQEAMRGIEYSFAPGQPITAEPFPHDAARLAQTAEFSDLYGSLGNGFFSYRHDEFPGTAAVERMHEIYRHPCLSHEIGILGGYLDFSLEARYEGTFIGTDLFRAARENMQRHGVWKFAQLYFEKNCRFLASLRKQLIENLRSCSNITGYDYLGGIDSHWHLTGYPCGIFNEFYEEKPGETISDIRRYNDETVLLCGASNRRNLEAEALFSERIMISHFGATALNCGKLHWKFSFGDATVAAGDIGFGGVAPGTVVEIGSIEFPLPRIKRGQRGTLWVGASSGEARWENRWDFWVFPAPPDSPPEGVVVDRLDAAVVNRIAAGGAVLVTGGFPGETIVETFRPHTSGRVLGHAGALIYDHPVWSRFPHDGFADWQFFPMMRGSHSLVNDAGMPEFSPLMELIPSFKLVRRKSLLSEFSVGKGRMICCGLVFDDADPAARWLRHELVNYLVAGSYVAAPQWPVPDLLARVAGTAGTPPAARREAKIDAGGRPEI